VNLIISLDSAVFLFFNAYLIHPVLDFVTVRITELSFWLIPGIIAAVLFVKREKKKAVIVLGLLLVTIAISDPVSSQILKKIFARPRPCHPDFFVEGGRFLLGLKSSKSFPSSHSMNMFAMAMLFYRFYPPRAFLFFGFASVIAYTRVYTGVHFPLDVLGGALLGCMIGDFVYESYDIVCKKLAAASQESAAAREAVQFVNELEPVMEQPELTRTQ
jgi:undecaprenyl-diphosphatase